MQAFSYKSFFLYRFLTKNVVFREICQGMMRLFDKAPIHRDAVGILDFSYHDDAVKATDAVDVAQGVEHEVLVVLHVVGIHLDLEIVIASGVVAFRNLVYLLHGVHKLLYQVVGVLLQSDVAEHNDVVTQLVMIYHG